MTAVGNVRSTDRVCVDEGYNRCFRLGEEAVT